MTRLLKLTAPLLAIAAMLAESAARAAWWNVAVNLPQLDDEGAAGEIRRQCAEMLEGARARASSIEAECAESGKP